MRVEGALTAPTDFEVNVEILFGIAFGLTGRSSVPGRCPRRLALLRRTLVVVNLYPLLYRPVLVFLNPVLFLFDKGGQSDRPVIRDFHVWRGASNPQSCDRGIDLHVAGLRHLARN